MNSCQVIVTNWNLHLAHCDKRITIKSLVYVRRDTHKENYSLCTYLLKEGNFVNETKKDTEPSLIKNVLIESRKYISFFIK